MAKKKDPKDMTPEERKDIKVVFAPGSFDNFDGTQEELDELLTEIHRLIETGELFEKAVPLDELDDDELRNIAENVGNADKRNLQ